MSLLNRHRPKLRNSDPDVRAEAVRELEKEEVDLLTGPITQDRSRAAAQINGFRSLEEAFEPTQ